MSLNPVRLRRNRQSQFIRDLIEETKLSIDDLVYPMFVTEGSKIIEPIQAMPGQSRYSLDELLKKVEDVSKLGIKGLALFPALSESKKDSLASESSNKQGLFQNTIRAIKKLNPDLVLFTDVAMDPYSSDGHDGVIENGKIINDKTLPILANMALSQAEAGTDFVAPSDMMDGRVGLYVKL